MMVEKHLEEIIDASLRLARKYDSQCVSLEHLVLVLIGEHADVRALLHQCGVDIEALYTQLAKMLETPSPIKPMQTHSHILVNTFGKTNISTELKRVLQRTFLHIQTLTLGHTTHPNLLLLLAVVCEQNSRVSQLLKKFHMSEDVLLALVEQSSAPQEILTPETTHTPDSAVPSEQRDEREDTNKNNKNKKAKYLELYTVNLNEKAKSGAIDPVIGRDEIIQRLQQILLRRKKNNALLIGEAGVGKTAIFEGLALAIVAGKTGHHMTHSVLYALDMTVLLAGAKYRGDFEQRLKGVLDELVQVPHAVLCIDEAHMLIGAGSGSDDSMDAANLLKPMLAANGLRCIAATTQQEYRRHFSDDKALMRRFQTIQVAEPTQKETYAIIKSLLPLYESFHDIRYTDVAVKEAVALGQKYIHERHNPDKTIDIIDEAGSWQKAFGHAAKIGKKDIASAISRMTGVPIAHLTCDIKQLLVQLESKLQQDIFGQDAVISQLTKTIKSAHFALRSGNKPLGNFLFVGPTGVGKTALCQSLAKHLQMKLLRFDMSEYSESHSTSRFIGAPPGYVGFDQAGAFTEAVWNNPYSVILLDEIEKAHANLYSLLLQVMDHGELTDNHGRTVSFRHAIVIMTSNVGVSHAMRNQMGFQPQDNRSDIMIEICRLFTPEFRNRLDNTILFNSISPEVADSILEAELAGLTTQLAQRGLHLSVTDTARHKLVELGFDPMMGARPLQRAIEQHIQQPLADLLLTIDRPQNQSVIVSTDKKRKHAPLTVRLQEKKQPVKRKTKSKRESRPTVVMA